MMTQAQHERLAQRIRELRTRNRWSLQELAEKSSVSRATLSRIENAEVSPNTEVLGKLCTTFRMTLTRLLAPIEMSFQALVKRDEQAVWVDEETGYQRRLVSPPSGSLSAEVIHCSLQKDSHIQYDGPPVDGLEHHLVMLEGELEVTIGEDVYELSPGDCLRYQLFGSSAFKTGNTNATYLLFLD